MPYRTPRVALIVVLPENHVLSADRLAALHQSVGDAQFLLAPAGTTTEELRELAMRQVPGDIVTLLGGSPISASSGDAELFMTS
jgi:hypothetical protein